MSDILEKSLDEIIGEKKKEIRRSGPKGSRSRAGASRNQAKDSYRPQGSSIPREIQESADSRPLLRARNIHSDLNGEDLSNLFSSVAPVEFVKFDPRKPSVAYICFQYDFAKNNSAAIAKYDGKKAMGKILIVENATSLADRISVAPQSRRGITKEPRRDKDPRREIRGREKNARARTRRAIVKQPKASLEDLDLELDSYMNRNESAEAPAEAPAESAAPEHYSAPFAAQDNGMSVD